MEEFKHKYELVKYDALERDELVKIMLQKIADLELRADAVDNRASRMMTAQCDGNHGHVPVILPDVEHQITRWPSRISPEYYARIDSPEGLIDDNAPFVVVLMHGNASMLLNEHVKAGKEGGAEAAKRFHDYLIAHLMERNVFENPWRLIVKFYASMSDLGTIYLKSGVIDHLSTWRDFIEGFNNTVPLSYFVDAGDVQCATDNVIQDQLELFFGHPNCQHTILIGSADGSYTGFLRQYSREDGFCGSMTMVEAIPFPGEFHELAHRFLPAENDKLFVSKDPYTPSPSPRKTHRRLSSVPTMLRPGVRPKPRIAPLRMEAPLPPPPIYDQYRTPSPTRKTSVPQTSPTASPTSRTAPRSQPQLVRRKPLAALQQPRTPQFRMPRSKQLNAFFDSKGQRIDSGSYVNMYTARYLG